MTRANVVRRLVRAGFDPAEAEQAVDGWSERDWPELVRRAESERPDLDACDDVEADEVWA